jgi:transposase
MGASVVETRITSKAFGLLTGTGRVPLADGESARHPSSIVGRPRRRPDQLVGDRGYDYQSHRRQLRQRGIRPAIARRQTEHGSGVGRFRWVVERTFAWLHQFRRLLVRYERRADIHEVSSPSAAASSAGANSPTTPIETSSKWRSRTRPLRPT